MPAKCSLSPASRPPDSEIPTAISRRWLSPIGPLPLPTICVLRGFARCTPVGSTLYMGYVERHMMIDCHFRGLFTCCQFSGHCHAGVILPAIESSNLPVRIPADPVFRRSTRRRGQSQCKPAASDRRLRAPHPGDGAGYVPRVFGSAAISACKTVMSSTRTHAPRSPCQHWGCPPQPNAETLPALCCPCRQGKTRRLNFSDCSPTSRN